jgi:glycosyltransferase involved in cell wall biosynthesis
MMPNNLIKAASFSPTSLQYPNAWIGHLPFAAWLIQEVSPKIFVELGTHSGNSYFSFCQAVVEMDLTTKCYAVDTWEGDEHTTQYTDEVFSAANAHNREHYVEFSQLMRMTFDDAVSYFSDESIELLHIDGLHTYEAVSHDFQSWLPKLAPGAVVLFHDTNVRERNFGVWKLWEELQDRYPNNVEFVHSHGLGVLQINNAPDDKTLSWLKPGSPEKQQLKNYFASLGACQLQRFEITELNRHIENLTQRVSNLNQHVSNLDQHVDNLNQAATVRDKQIVDLNQAVAERDGTIRGLKKKIADLYSSTSWRITKPLRFISRLLHGKLHKNFRFTRPRDKLPFAFPALYDNHNIKPNRETILVVSHEASRTGAPVLSLNIVQALAPSYNVLVLLLGGGPLSDAFRLAGAAVMTSSNLRGNPDLAYLIVGQLCDRFNFKFALVNSIESRLVLPALCNYFVPAISLLHEFAAYTRPRDAFRDALFWSGEVVFSANVTLENALAEYPDLRDRSAHILPQGRCLLPTEFSEEQRQADCTHIRRLIRPKGLVEDTVIVLGAGSVQLRKGVDLFIECAARVVRTPEGNKCRFVWIGSGYDPENDVGYSVYLADQIRRANLQGHVLFIDETAAIETAYEEADLFLLSSRLDPLPNVAIDAMSHGVPVLCFDKTTGIADFLIKSGLRKHCVAEYLDTSNMAKKILALAGSQALRKDVAGQCRTASIAYFNMDEYVASLEVLAKEVCEYTQQEKVDTQTILGSGLFRRDFSCPPHQQGHLIEDEVRFYVRAWASGISRRKPFPGFHPGVYLEQHGVATQGADPFADYLRAGRPNGTWLYPVIVAGETKNKDLPDNHRVALHLHVYYPELLPEITTRLFRNRIRPDLFISIVNEGARTLVVNELKNYKGKVVDIQLVPNRGRDIGSFLTVFGPKLSVNYDFIGHLHTKKTADLKDSAIGKTWYRFLLENLLGNESEFMADSVLAKMKNDTSIGMVFPDDPYIVGWGSNLAFAEPLAARMGLEKLPEHFTVPVGSMFWARSSALAPLINLNLGWDDYPDEPLPYDGSPLHAIERLFSLALSVTNLRSATTNIAGLTR